MIKKALKRRNNKNEMTFVEHLEDLRWMLIRIILSVLVGAIIVFIKLDFFFDTILMAPAKKDFISFKVLCAVGKFLHLDKWCEMQYDIQFQSTKMAAQFMMSFTFAFAFGLIVAFPYIIHQIWQFIKPALYDKENVKIKGFIFFITLFFIAGIGFGYYVIAPYSFMFFSNYQLSSIVENRFLISDYIIMLTQIVIGCGLLFQLPILIFTLTKIGLTTPDFYKKNRKYAIVAVLLLASVITPPDFFSQLIVSFPLLFLYEVSIWVSMYVYKRMPKI